MAQAFPYTYYSCPCVNTTTPLPILTAHQNRKTSREVPPIDSESSDEEDNFDPKAPRSNFSLFPLEHLLWCTECHQMRCARCMAEEVVCWYCPTCLFEVPSSTVRSEGNRCTRNCYNCPICTSPLSISSYEPPTATAAEAPSGPFILACSWCNWTSLDIGIELEKHNNVTGQLSKIRNGGKPMLSPKDREAETEKLLRRGNSAQEADSGDDDGASPKTERPGPEDIFSRLNAFYRTQILESSETGLFSSMGSSDMPFSSPGSISRLLNIYSGKKTKRTRPRPMRESLVSNEGLSVFNPDDEDDVLARQQDEGWNETATFEQRNFQAPSKHDARFVDELRPVASLLRTKRAKRCRTCRTLLAKPEPRMNSSRWRIRVLALNNIPKISLRALNAPATIGPNMGVASALDQSQQFDYKALETGKTYQFLLTVLNPLYDPIKVTLATPSHTPDRVKTSVTILCPQFNVGANSDVWDDALESSSKRKSVMPGAMLSSIRESDPAGRQAEAGKIWGTGRNWTSVIVEIVPGLLPLADELEEDEEVLEIAVFVRLEYETDVTGGEEKASGTSGAREKREDAFWCVLGAGQIKLIG